MTTATIFINSSNEFDSRFDAQALPAGSIVVGFMMWRDSASGGEISELIDAPAIAYADDETLKPEWLATLNEARETLRNW